MPPPLALRHYIRQAGFEHAVQLRDFCFDTALLSVGRMHYHPTGCGVSLGSAHKRGAGGGCLHDFGTHYQMEPWDMVEEYLGARPSPVHDERRVVFAIRMRWLRERLQQMPNVADEVTWRQYAVSR
ncbi:hypothetical protein PIB30_099128 [Stylosanthes scabra]|uniref:Uncharacterized protein n=1 Tax=Stylosanthes scabra TaxID=79078 RepID=A0ABU6YYN3_9FABA|nr:hypothetical protein [Stylosanthes scabra]